MSVEGYDYQYELTDEQLLRYGALPALAKLRWLDQARRFTLRGREARAKTWKVAEPEIGEDGK